MGTPLFKLILSAVVDSIVDTKEVMYEHANVAMLKLNGILKSRKEWRPEGSAVLINDGHCMMRMMHQFVGRPVPWCKLLGLGAPQ
jgi:hypothetical protein